MSTPARTLVVVHDRLGPPSGMGKVVQFMVETAGSAGWRVVVIAAEVTAPPPAGAEVQIIPARRRLPGAVEHERWTWTARRQLRRVNADVVHVHSPALADVASLWSCHFLAGPAHHLVRPPRMESIKAVARRAQYEAGWRLDDMRCRSLTTANIAFVSSFLRDQFESRYGPPRLSTVLSPPAPPWNPVTTPERQAARARYGLLLSSLVVSFLGGVDERKGLDRVLALADCPDVELLVAGRGSERLTQSGLRGLGVVDTRELLAASDVVVAPAVFDSAPVVVLEAVAADRPVVLSETNGWAGDVLANDAGVVLGGLESLRDGVERARHLSPDGRRAFTDAFSRSRVGQQLLRLYDDLA